jgi:hypothetical protein
MLENYELNIDKVQAGLSVPKDTLTKFAMFVGGLQNSKTGNFTLRLSSAKESAKKMFISRKRRR